MVPFIHVITDCVSPLPKTKSANQYQLTRMCRFTCFPEAIPLRNIKVPQIADSLVTFFTFVGLPVSVQSDQCSNFMSNVMRQVMYQLGIKQCNLQHTTQNHKVHGNAFIRHWKPWSRITVFNTRRNGTREYTSYFLSYEELYRSHLGLADLNWSSAVLSQGPLKLLKESWLMEDPSTNLLDQVSTLRSRLTVAVN